MSMTIALAMAVLAGMVEPERTVLTVNLTNVRNARGSIHACLTRAASHFPDCRSDPAAVRATVPAASRRLRFENISSGHYAITVFHDENENRRLDMMLMVPREGFGFSGNPKVRFGPPTFEQVTVTVAAGLSDHTIRLQYLL